MPRELDYDPSKIALYHPESQASLLDSEQPWTQHALCAELSRLAYWHFEDDGEILLKFQAVLERAGFSEPKLFNNNSTSPQSCTQCFATIRDATVYVVFRGTQPDDPTDILIDGMFLPVHWQGAGMVHDGFLRAYDSIAAKLSDWLEQHEDKKIYFTGHSLGAAVATLAASCTENSRLVTFGSPRVGDAEFADIFTHRPVARYVNCCDIITCLPPESPYYQHVHGIQYLDRHGNLIPAPSALDMLQDQTIAKAEYMISDSWKNENVGFRSLADHAAVNYVKSLLTN